MFLEALSTYLSWLQEAVAGQHQLIRGQLPGSWQLFFKLSHHHWHRPAACLVLQLFSQRLCNANVAITTKGKNINQAILSEDRLWPWIGWRSHLQGEWRKSTFLQVSHSFLPRHSPISKPASAPLHSISQDPTAQRKSRSVVFKKHINITIQLSKKHLKLQRSQAYSILSWSNHTPIRVELRYSNDSYYIQCAKGLSRQTPRSSCILHKPALLDLVAPSKGTTAGACMCMHGNSSDESDPCGRLKYELLRENDKFSGVNIPRFTLTSQ